MADLFSFQNSNIHNWGSRRAATPGRKSHTSRADRIDAMTRRKLANTAIELETGRPTGGRMDTRGVDAYRADNARRGTRAQRLQFQKERGDYRNERRKIEAALESEKIKQSGENRRASVLNRTNREKFRSENITKKDIADQVAMTARTTANINAKSAADIAKAQNEAKVLELAQQNKQFETMNESARSAARVDALRKQYEREYGKDGILSDSAANEIEREIELLQTENNQIAQGIDRFTDPERYNRDGSILGGAVVNDAYSEYFKKINTPGALSRGNFQAGSVGDESTYLGTMGSSIGAAFDGFTHEDQMKKNEIEGLNFLNKRKAELRTLIDKLSKSKKGRKLLNEISEAELASAGSSSVRPSVK